MIWLLLDALCGGLPVGTILMVVLCSAVACCALCAIYRCSRFRLRDCAFFKRCMRATGADKFDDFEVMILVHEALYTTSQTKLVTAVRVTAGAHMVQTDGSNKGIFQQPLAIFVEQGTETVEVELIDSRARRVLAVLKLDTVKDILHCKTISSEKVYTMKQKNKTVVNPRVKMTIHLESGDDVEKSLLSGIAMSTEADLMLRQQLSKLPDKMDADQSQSRAAVSELDLVAKGCCGPLDMFGNWGTREAVYVMVRGPPDYRKHCLCIYKDEQEYLRGQKPKDEVDLLKVVSVQADPGRVDVFTVHYVADKVQKKLAFRRMDRARDVWVEMLQLMIKMIREAKDKKKDTKGPS